MTTRKYFEPGDLVVPDLENQMGREIEDYGIILGEVLGLHPTDETNILVRNVIVNARISYIVNHSSYWYKTRFKKVG